MLEAAPGCCEDESSISREFYIPCNRPAARLVYHSRDKRAYRMCDMCAWHNIKNHGGTDYGRYIDANPDLEKERT